MYGSLKIRSGGQPVGRTQRIQFMADEFVRFFGERDAFIEHRVNLAAQGAHAPALDPAHLSVELTLERLLERQQGDDVCPAQLSYQ